MKKSILLLSTFTLVFSAFANDHGDHEHREGQVHTHGHAQSQIILDDNDLDIHIFGAADSFIGFEHAPETAGEEAKIAEIKKHIDAGDIVTLNKEAQCVFKDGNFDLDIAEGEHANVEIELEYECAMAEKLTEITYNWSAFHHLEELDAEFLGGDKIAKEELTAEHNMLHLD
ncbi:MAG: DUF2796 domain-containing protein [Alphaproteobacteria bacterium]